MKGLLLKDWYMIASYCRRYLFIPVIFAAMIFLGENNLFFLFYPCILCGMIPVNLIAYDERSRWTQYSETLPYTRAQIVSSKYLISLFLQAAITLCMSVTYGIKTSINGFFLWSDILTTVLIMFGVGALSCALCLPFIFKLGVEKGQFSYYVTIALMAALCVAVPRVLQINVGADLDIPLALLSIVCMGFYALSWYLSIIFYRKREL